MKKKELKCIAVLMAASMTLGLAGCGNDNAGNSNEGNSSAGNSGTAASGGADSEETEGSKETGGGDSGEGQEENWARPFDKYIQDEEPVDLGGYEFHIADFNTDIWGPEEIKSTQDQLVVDIIEDVENTFNCTITVENVSPDQIYDTANPSLMAGDKFADLVGTTMWAFGTLLSSNHVADVSNVESLDLSLDCFNHNLSDMATFGDSVYGFGAAFGSHLTNHWVIFYNAKIWDELGLPDPYELVRNNEWTWDKLAEYAKKALQDKDGNGVVDSESDRWGMVSPSGDLMRGMYISMGGTFYESNSDGKMRLSCLDSESSDKMTFIYNFFQNDKVLYMNENEGYLDLFAAGKSLFLAYGNGTFDELKDMEDDFGVLPMPKWDAAQENYLNPIDHNAKIYCMTDTNRNTYEAGVIITALAKRYQAYDDLRLEDMEDIYWRFPDEDAEMVKNYVVGHGGYNVIDVIKRANSSFELPSSAMWDGVYNNMYTDITSTIASTEDALNIYLDEFFDNLSKPNGCEKTRRMEMKKKMSKISAKFMTGAMAAALAAGGYQPLNAKAADDRVVVPRFDAAPVIDGKIDDGEWGEAAFTVQVGEDNIFARTSDGVTPGPDDFNADIYLGYDSTHVYIAAVAEYAIHKNEALLPSDLWQGDCMQIQISDSVGTNRNELGFTFNSLTEKQQAVAWPSTVRIEHIDFSPSYWVSGGLYERAGMGDPFADPEAEEMLRDHLYQNASGINMRRNDWSYTCYVEVEGYRYGYRAMKTAVEGLDSMPNGHHYGMEFRNCQTVIEIQASAYAGIMFTYIDIEDCENGIVFTEWASGPAQFQETKIAASNQAVYMDILSGAKVQMSQCGIVSGAVTVDAGVLDIADCDFENAADGVPHLSIGLSGRANMVGNRYNGERKVENKSLFVSHFSDEDVQMEKLPEYVEIAPQVKIPAAMKLYLVTDYGAAADGGTDCTEAVRQALADASAGGGIVFFPPGHYRFDDTLSVPAGVELRGACDNSTVPHGEGTILEVYCGEGDLDAEPFLQLQEGSGIRGVTVNYPNQIYKGTGEEEPDYAPIPYPYTIQGQGKDIYMINVGLRASYLGVDLFTYQCDNHYVDFLTGQMFMVGMRIGGGSKDGVLMNMQCNTIVYACGQESKFGSFPNSPAAIVPKDPVYDYAFYHLDNLILGDCENELLYNDFNYGAHKGIVFTNEGNGGAKDGLAIGFGIDKDCRGFYFEEGIEGVDFDFVNTQVVSTEAKEETEYLYSEKGNDFRVVLYGGDFWGNPSHFVKMGEDSGTLIVQNSRMNHPGKSTFAVMEGGTLVLKASISEKMSGTAVISNDAKVEFRACVMDNAGVNTEDYVWADNLSLGAEMAQDNGVSFLGREGWTADASHNLGNALRALDGNPATRWDTAGVQAPGQWFLVDTGEGTEFDCVFLEFSGSAGDAPAEYEIFVSDDGENWGDPIASGQKGSGIIPVEPQRARYVKIAQNGSAGGYWSIHEFYLLKLE